MTSQSNIHCYSWPGPWRVMCCAPAGSLTAPLPPGACPKSMLHRCPSPAPVGLAPLTALSPELLGSTPVACTRHCNHARGFHGAGLLEHHRPVGLALLTGRPPQWLDSTPFACKSISFLFTATVTQKTTTPERPQHIHYTLHYEHLPGKPDAACLACPGEIQCQILVLKCPSIGYLHARCLCVLEKRTTEAHLSQSTIGHLPNATVGQGSLDLGLCLCLHLLEAAGSVQQHHTFDSVWVLDSCRQAGIAAQ